jgi:hypothetical protein
VPFTEKVVAAAPGFVIADTRDNSAFGATATFTSHARAQDALAAQIKANPAMAGNLHVIPAAEVKEAA